MSDSNEVSERLCTGAFCTKQKICTCGLNGFYPNFTRDDSFICRRNGDKSGRNEISERLCTGAFCTKQKICTCGLNGFYPICTRDDSFIPP